MRKIFVIFALFLTSCAANGPAFETSSLKPPQGSSKIVIYRQKGFVGSGRSPDVQINGNVSCEIPQGGFFTKEIHPGNTTLSISLWDAPGTTRYSFNAEKGNTHFIKVSPNKENIMAGATFGLAGMLVENTGSNQGGQFIFTQESKEQALVSLKDTKESISCN